MLIRLKRWASAIKCDALAIRLAARDPRVPWGAKLLALCVAGYAFCPIDLIPDFVPVLGLVDDAVILPLGILLVVKLIPPEIMAEHRRAAAQAVERPIGKAAAILVVLSWVAAAAVAGWFALGYVPGGSPQHGGAGG